MARRELDWTVEGGELAVPQRLTEAFQAFGADPDVGDAAS
jgi:hypothetical protein